MGGDLDTWADAYIRSPEMTADAWNEARRIAARPLLSTPLDDRFSVAEARALLRARDRVIAGLSEAQRRGLLLACTKRGLRPHGPTLTVAANLEDRGLVESNIPSQKWPTLVYWATPLGHECAWVIREEAGNA